VSAAPSVVTKAGAARKASALLRLLAGRVSWVPVLAAVALLVIMFFVFHSYFPNFTSPRNLSSLLVDNAYLIVLAAGMTFVIISGGIDLSVGAVMAFTGVLAANLLRAGVPTGFVVVVMVITGSLSGLLIGILVQFFDVQPFIASLAGMFLSRGLCYVLAPRAIQVKDDGVLGLQNTTLGDGASWSTTPAVIIALAVVALGAWALLYTRFGRTVYAIGGNAQSARLMGLYVVRSRVLVYVISGACAGIAGLLFTAYTAAGYAQNGVGTELDTIAAVVIGGTLLTGGSGYILGSLIGVLVYGVIKSAISFMGAEQSWTRITIGILLLAFVLVQRLIVARASRR
jgi:galactofuranose transport system permease protein